MYIAFYTVEHNSELLWYQTNKKKISLDMKKIFLKCILILVTFG